MESIVTRWWWIRHAPVTTDGGRIYGQTDLPGDTSDPAPYAPLARRLPRDAVWVASHLRRTHDTAAAIRKADPDAGFGEPEIFHGLAEQHFGEWQGQERKEIFRRYGADHGFWLAPAETAPPGGESFADLMDRVALAIDAINGRYAGRDVVGLALELPPARSIGFVVDNCSLTRIDHIKVDDGSDVWRINSINEVLHL